MPLPALNFLVVYPLVTLVSAWLLASLFSYTLKATPYARKTRFTLNYIDPGLMYFRKKALIVGVDFGYTVFKTFRAKMGNDSNIEYHGHYCLVHVRDRGRSYKLYLPFHKNLRREARYKITSEGTKEGGDRDIENIYTVPGVPILVSPKEMGKDVIKCSKPNGDVVWSYKEDERPVCHMSFGSSALH